MAQISACAFAAEIASSGVPISLMAGFPDLTAASGIHAFYHAAKAPGEYLMPPVDLQSFAVKMQSTRLSITPCTDKLQLCRVY